MLRCPTRGNHIAWPRWWILGCRRHRPHHSHALPRSPQGYHSDYNPNLPKREKEWKEGKSLIRWKSRWGQGIGQKETSICSRWNQKGSWEMGLEEEQRFLEEIQPRSRRSRSAVLPPYILQEDIPNFCLSLTLSDPVSIYVTSWQ